MSFLYSIFEKMFQKEIKQKINIEKANALEAYREAKHKENKQFKLFDMETLLGKPVISISNEWDNPIVGFVTNIEFLSKAQNPTFVIQDYVSNEKVIVMGITYGYTEQRFNALMKLDPFETCSLIYQNYCSTSLNPFEKNKSGIRESKEMIIQKLKENGFYQKLNNFPSDKGE